MPYGSGLVSHPKQSVQGHDVVAEAVVLLLEAIAEAIAEALTKAESSEAELSEVESSKAESSEAENIPKMVEKNELTLVFLTF
jgi:hypothetical protein